MQQNCCIIYDTFIHISWKYVYKNVIYFFWLQTKNCPLCKILSRSTENSPSVLHQTVALPAIVGAYWYSERCESFTGGIWFKRQFQMHSGDRLWIGRWNYYNDPQCKDFRHTTIAFGNYVQRVAKRKYYRKRAKRETFLGYNKSWKDVTKHTIRRKVKRQATSTDGVNQYLRNIQSSAMDEWRIVAMLQSRRMSSDQTRTAETFSTSNGMLTGVTELDLHILGSMLIIKNSDKTIYCRSNKLYDVSSKVPQKYCFPYSTEVPSVLKLLAKITVNWNGQYILLLSEQNDYVWQAPLRRCTFISPYNPELRNYFYKSFAHRLELSSSTARTISQFSVLFYLLQFFLLYVYYFVRWYHASEPLSLKVRGTFRFKHALREES